MIVGEYLVQTNKRYFTQRLLPFGRPADRLVDKVRDKLRPGEQVVKVYIRQAVSGDFVPTLIEVSEVPPTQSSANSTVLL